MSKPSMPSFVRTIVPVLVGQIIAYIATLGIVVPGDVETALTVILGFVATTLWYTIFRWLEQRFPKLGVLLGWAAVPESYTPAKDREAKH